MKDFTYTSFNTFSYISRKASLQKKSFVSKVLDKTPKIPFPFPFHLPDHSIEK